MTKRKGLFEQPTGVWVDQLLRRPRRATSREYRGVPKCLPRPGGSRAAGSRGIIPRRSCASPSARGRRLFPPADPVVPDRLLPVLRSAASPEVSKIPDPGPPAFVLLSLASFELHSAHGNGR